MLVEPKLVSFSLRYHENQGNKGNKKGISQLVDIRED